MKDCDKIVSLLRYVSEETLLERQKDYSTTYKEDRTLVTTVDVMADAIIRSGLQEICGDIRIVSEETWKGEAIDADSEEGYFAVDPIDGTSTFVKGGDYCVNVAYIKNGKPVDGWIAVPTEGTVTYTDGSAVKRINGEKIFLIGDKARESERKADEYVMIANARSVVKNGTLFSIGSVKQHLLDSGFNISNVLTNGTAAIKYCMLAEGLGDFVVAFGKFMLWDIAAGQAIASRLGYTMIDEYGRDVQFITGKPYQIVFTHRNDGLKDSFIGLFSSRTL